MYVIIHLPKPIACTSPRVNPKANYGLRAIMMSPYQFILGKKCTILVSAVDHARGCACVWQVRWQGYVGNLCTFLSILLLKKKNEDLRRSHCGAVEMNPTRNHEVSGSIPGLPQGVKDPVFP